MTHLPDDDARLTILLRAISGPEPSPDLLAGARRRYNEALAARYRREALLGFVAACAGLALLATLPLFFFDPADLIAGTAVAAAGATRWLTGVITVLSIVPPAVWAFMALSALASLLPALALARPRRLPVAK